MLSECPNSKRNKHYLKRYVRFVAACLEKNKDLPNDVYTEKHHILPKSIWPEYKDFKISPWNMAVLTARQHLLSHWILALSFGGRMYSAFWYMLNIRNMDVEDYGISDEYRKYVSLRVRKYNDGLSKEERSKKYGHHKESHHTYGKPRSEETRKKISVSNKGKHSGELNGMYGSTHSEESKYLMSKNNAKCWSDYKWFNNGKISKRFLQEEVPENWVEGRLDMPSGESHPNYGGFISEETKDKIRESTSGENNHFFGKTHSKETKKLLSEKAKNRSKIECPHCKKIGAPSPMRRWHFDNCKYK